MHDDRLLTKVFDSSRTPLPLRESGGSAVPSALLRSMVALLPWIVISLVIEGRPLGPSVSLSTSFRV